MENVPNLLTAEGGFFRQEIQTLFNSMGYQLNMGVLNASDYGVPQNRRRAVIIGKRDSEAPQLPVPCIKFVNIWDAISDLAYLNSGEGEEEQAYSTDPESDYQKEMRRDSGKLFNHVVTKHSKLALERLAMIPPMLGKKFFPRNI